MKGLAIHTAVLVGAMLVGFPLGFLHARGSMGEGARLLPQALALSEYEDLANLQYKHADTVHGMQAQMDLLSFMHQLETRQKIAAPRALAYDRARALLRLALLEERSGSKEASQNYIHQAQEVFQDCDHRLYPEDTLRRFIAQADESIL